MKLKHRGLHKASLGLSAAVLILGVLLSGCSDQGDKQSAKSSSPKTSQSTKVQTASQTKTPASKKKKETKSDQKKTYRYLASLNFKSGSLATKTLDNDSAKIKPKNFSTPHIKFSHLDSLGRSHTATAYLTKQNLGSDAGGRAEQTVRPTGWNNQPREVNGKRVFPQNRGHIIAYTISFGINNNGKYEPGAGGSFNNPLNLFTQTAYSNQQPMQQNETMVRNALEEGKHVIYKVTPVYRGNNLMANGVWVRGTATDGSMHFNRYIFNVQPGLKFDYQNGTNQIDPQLKVNGVTQHFNRSVKPTVSRNAYYHSRTAQSTPPRPQNSSHEVMIWIKPSVRHYKNGRVVNVRGYWRRT